MAFPVARPRNAFELFGGALRFVFDRAHVLLAATLPIFVPLFFWRAIRPEVSPIVNGALQLVSPIMAAVAGAIVLDELGDGERHASVSTVLDRLRGRWGLIAAVAFVEAILVSVGFRLLILPGLLALIYTAVVPVVVVAERDTGLLAWACPMAIWWIASIMATPFAGEVGIFGRGWMFLQSVGYVVLQTVAGAATALLYFDLRHRELPDVSRVA